VNSKKNIPYTERTEAITAEVLRVINAIKHSDVSQQMNDSKENIFNRINDKIEAESYTSDIKINKRKWLVRYLSIASVITLLIVSISTLTYRMGYNSKTNDLVQADVELIVPAGTLSQIRLPDGTHVTLNGGSVLTYPASFEKTRQVTLTGEGYFDVVKDEKRPFIVNSNNLSAKVLGTRFGFKAYNDDCQTILTLEEGSVCAFPADNHSKEGFMLKPDQQIIIENETGEFQRRNVNAKEYISWKDGILTFRDQTLGEIAIILERRFDVRIKISSELIQSQRYAAQFKYGENVEQILDKLSYKRSWKYVKQNGIIELINR